MFFQLVQNEMVFWTVRSKGKGPVALQISIVAERSCLRVFFFHNSIFPPPHICIQFMPRTFMIEAPINYPKTICYLLSGYKITQTQTTFHKPSQQVSFCFHSSLHPSPWRSNFRKLVNLSKVWFLDWTDILT